jgi:murein DD-endopeptidase MepM/ murein hydrolase activator NlpD
VSTAYFHLDSAQVREGDRVTAQSVLGRAGSTGLTTGPHLHFGLYIHGHDVDPAAWMDMPAWMRSASTP